METKTMETKTKPRFHITVTDLSTNETLVDQDTSAIIGAIDAVGGGTDEMVFTYCNGVELVSTLLGVKHAADITLKRAEPMTVALFKMMEDSVANEG